MIRRGALPTEHAEGMPRGLLPCRVADDRNLGIDLTTFPAEEHPAFWCPETASVADRLTGSFPDELAFDEE